MICSEKPVPPFSHHALTARAAILLFDQIPRNIFRESPRAFTYDPLARTITRAALRRRSNRGLSRAGRQFLAQFLAMPLMHSEARADQLASLRIFAALGDADTLAFARAHAAVVARFGRFAHRNALLGRTSSAAERRAIATVAAW